MTWRKVESLIFPLSATLIGLGYAAAILANNESQKVMHSPHALALLAIFAAITFFSLRTLIKDIRSGDPDAK